MSTSDQTFDPSRRRLCPDGACIGLIGEDGRCKVCGRAASGAAGPAPAREAEAQAEPDDEAPSPEGGLDPRRKLCSDGSCIGLLGEDGRCKVCGREG